MRLSTILSFVARRRLRPAQAHLELVLAIAVAVATWYPVVKGLLEGQWQWDFRAYYGAGRAWAHGKNPYRHEDVVAALGEDCYQFVYSPLVLPGFALLAKLPLPSALAAWATIKTGCLLALAVVWFKYFIPPRWRFWFTLLCAFGYAETITQDLVTGNVSLIEQCLLWSAFAFFQRGRHVAFAALTVAASVFKLTLAVFLLLLAWPMLRDRCRRLRRCALAGVSGVAIVIAAYSLAPGRWRAFLQSAAECAPGGSHFEFGASCPSTGAVIWEVFRRLRSHLPYGFVFTFWALYLFIAVAIVFVTWLCIRMPHPRAAFHDGQRLWAITIACILFAILSPRFKDYSYILLLVPTCRVLWHHSRDALPPVLLIGALLVPPTSPRIAELHQFFALLSQYYPLVVAFAVWAIAVYGLRRPGLVLSAGGRTNESID